MGSTSDAIERFSKEMMESALKVEEEIIKELLSCTSINPDEVTSDNVKEVMQNMKDRGYRIENTMHSGNSTFNLYHHDIFQIGIELKSSTEFKDGEFKTTVRKRIVTKH